MLKTLSLATALALLGLSAVAQSSDTSENLSATLLSGWQTKAGTHMAGLQLTLAPGWKTYWRNPGEAGLPPLFNWSGSQNVKAVQIHWPSPVVFETNGMQSIGYHDAILLPLEVTPLDASRPMQLKATVELGICRDICVPASVTVSTRLPSPGAPVAAISAALAARPSTAAEAGVALATCEVVPIADGLQVTASLTMPRQGARETVVIEPGQADIWVASATAQRQADILTAVTEMVAPAGAPFALERSKIRLTVFGENGSVEIIGCPAP